MVLNVDTEQRWWIWWVSHSLFDCLMPKVTSFWHLSMSSLSFIAGYVQKITARKDIEVMEDLDNGKPPWTWRRLLFLLLFFWNILLTSLSCIFLIPFFNMSCKIYSFTWIEGEREPPWEGKKGFRDWSCWDLKEGKRNCLELY